MCTLTFQPGGGPKSRWILFNRDELRSRPKAGRPELFEGRGIPYLMPVDPQGGGSWMGLSAGGYFICLLNNYPGDAIVIDPSLRSRGRLVKDLLEAGGFPDSDVIGRRLHDHEYAPFYLAAFTKEETRLWAWDQKSLVSIDAGKGFLSSSGYRHSETSSRRARLYEGSQASQQNAGRKELYDFHLLENADDPSSGILMTRPDAMTVSVSEVELGEGFGRLFYREREALDSPSEHRLEFPAD